MTKYAGRAPYPFTPGDNMTGQCSDCGLVFFGESAFDYHRRGEEPNRHCIDPSSEPDRWSLDSRDRWHKGSEEDRAAVAARLRSAPGSLSGRPSVRRPARSGVSGTPRSAGRPETRESEGAV